MKVYLCGPINGCTDAECKDWREAAKAAVSGIEWADPMVRDYRGREQEPGIAAEIVENDKADIDGCDLILVNYDKPSVGTSMEVLWSWLNYTPVWVVHRQGEKLSPWLLYHCDRFFTSFEEAFDAIRAAMASLVSRRDNRVGMVRPRDLRPGPLSAAVSRIAAEDDHVTQQQQVKP